MAKLVIKDLSASVELDRQAMTAIVGGARIGERFGVMAHTQPTATQTVARGGARVVAPVVAPVVARVVARVVDYPPGFSSARQPVDERTPLQSVLRK